MGNERGGGIKETRNLADEVPEELRESSWSHLANKDVERFTKTNGNLYFRVTSVQCYSRYINDYGSCAASI